MKRGSLDGRLERAKEAALGPHDGDPTVADLVGEAAGGISGVIAGASIGSIVGPIGTVIGGIAGALGGWWSGRAIVEAVERLTEDDETYYRRHHASGASDSGRAYDDARPAYHLGHIAGMNPEYQGRRFEEIEEDLQRGWGDDVRNRYGEWDAVRGYVEAGFNRRLERSGAVTAESREPAGSEPATEPAREPADHPARGVDRVAPEGDRPPGDSSAARHRSIPRGTDEESSRP
jgi:hypothetical protein